MGTHERKEREKVLRREEIVDAAQKVFFAKGLATATMDEIAETAELSKGTLYLYYRSKEDLYLAVMMRGMEILRDMCLQCSAAESSGVRKLHVLARTYTEFFDAHRAYFRMFHFYQTPQFHRQVSAAMLDACSLLNNKLWALVVEIIEEAIREETFRADVVPKEIATMLWSSATALLLRIDAEQELWRERMQIDLRHTLELSNRLHFEALLTEKGRREYEAIAPVSEVVPLPVTN